jgi:hypothetical protein
LLSLLYNFSARIIHSGDVLVNATVEKLQYVLVNFSIAFRMNTPDFPDSRENPAWYYLLYGKRPKPPQVRRFCG